MPDKFNKVGTNVKDVLMKLIEKPLFTKKLIIVNYINLQISLRF